MKNLTLLIIAVFTSLNVVFAQPNQKEASFGSYSSSVNLSSEAVFTVLGAYAGSGKAGSDVSVIQTGNGNNSNLKLNGSGNVVNASQTGNSNMINMDFSGTNSKYVLDQDGNSNTINLDNITSTGINFKVIQKTNSNGLTINGVGTGALPSLKIEQSGGMKINITSNTFFLK